MKKTGFAYSFLAALAAALVACGGGAPEPTTASIGGTVTGLGGPTLLLMNSGNDPILIDADGRFSFPKRVAEGTTYDVTVVGAPNGLYCQVAKGSGTVVHDVNAISDIAVSCEWGFMTPYNKFKVGVTISGLLPGKSVTLANDGVALTAGDNGLFVFSDTWATARVSAGQAGGYEVTVQTQPTGQSCTVHGGSGAVTVFDRTNFVNVPVVCQ